MNGLSLNVLGSLGTTRIYAWLAPAAIGWLTR
jgi:hypothetical protein